MATSEAKEIKKQETLVRFSIISYKTIFRVIERSKTVHINSISVAPFYKATLAKNRCLRLIIPEP